MLLYFMQGAGIRRIIKIYQFQGNLKIRYKNKRNRRHYMVTLYAAGLDGEFTREDWQESEELFCLFDKKDQDLILDTLEESSQTPFFREVASQARIQA
jgi:predicted HTH transcriptional regulator